jgi:hypothetical protein
MFVWLSFTQTLGAFVAGGEAAWVFFGGRLSGSPSVHRNR